MNSLSLQNTQNTSVKKMSGSTNKTSDNAANATLGAASAEINSPFQNMLNKQVQAQQSPAKQAIVKPSEFKPATHNSANFNSANFKSANAKPAELKPVKLINKADHAHALAEAKLQTTNQAGSTTGIKKSDSIDLANEVDYTVNANAALADALKLDVKDTLKSDTDTKAAKDDISVVSNKVDANVNEVALLQLASAINVIPFMNTQTLAPASNATTQSLLTGDGGTTAQRNLATALGNALQQAKTASGSNADVQVIQDNTASSESNKWLEAMLPASSKQALGDEAANAKLIVNALKEGVAKDSLTKDIALKEINVPVTYQPAASLNVAATTQQVASANTINPYPGKTGWDQAISQKVVWMVGANEQSATLTLNPPDLGPLQVVIHVNNDQANTTFISDNAEVRQALEDGMSNLREKMSESGIQLGQANVSSGEQSQQQFQQAMQQGASAAQTSNSSAFSATVKSTDAKTIVRISNGLVDTFA